MGKSNVYLKGTVFWVRMINNLNCMTLIGTQYYMSLVLSVAGCWVKLQEVTSDDL